MLIGEWVESERLDPATTRYTITGLTSGVQFWSNLSTYLFIAPSPNTTAPAFSNDIEVEQSKYYHRMKI